MTEIQAVQTRDRRQISTAPPSDFLPDLCAPQAVLLLVMVAELLALLLALTRTGLAQMSWEVLALVSFQVQWVVLVSAVLLCRLKPFLRRWSPVRAGATSYGLVLVITLLFSIAGQLLMRSYFAQPLTLDYWQLGGNLVTAAILAGIGLRYLYLQQQLRNQQRAELQARIQALQSRIRPHFLFNSMNSIASLIAVDPVAAERAVEDLAVLFRASLAEPTLIPLERELDLCRGYLDIEQLRLGDRLRVTWRLEDLPGGITIPSMLLQPLLENAVFHGVEPSAGGGEIEIQITRAEQQLVIRIRNPVPPPSLHQRRSHNRMALDNIRHRLQAHYGPAASLSEDMEEGRFTLVIVYPLEP